MSKNSLMSYLSYIPLAPIRFPILEWIKDYNKDLLISDTIAGITVFVFLIPQGMAYAILGGMPAEYGLYTATVPLYIYAIFGTSKQLAIGPMAITSLLLGTAVQSYGYATESSDYINYALNLSLLVGIIVFLLGVFRLGTLANMISPSVLVGFITASALVISLSQLKYIFGIHVPDYTYNVQIIARILSHLDETNLNALLVGSFFTVFLYFIRDWRKKNKATPEKLKNIWFRLMYIFANLSNLISIVIGSVIAKAIYDGGSHIKVVGDVPSGLKTPGFSPIPFNDFINLIPDAIALAFVAFATNWAVAKKYAYINKYEVNASQELIAEGLACTIGVFFNAFVVCGGLARSSVNAENGAKTQIAGCITATLILISLLFLTSIFYYIPMCVLAAIIEVSVLSMIDFQEMIAAYYKEKKDCFVMWVTFLFTFFVGVTTGLYIGIAMSIAIIIYSTAYPKIIVLGKVDQEEGGHFLDVKRFPHAQQIPGKAIIRMDAPLYFANCAHFKETVIRAAKGDFHPSDKPIEIVIVEASAWIDIDLAAVTALFEIKKELNDMNGIKFAIACAKGKIRDKIRDSEFLLEIGEHHFNVTVEDAVFAKPPFPKFIHARKHSVDDQSVSDSNDAPNDNERIVANPARDKMNSIEIDFDGDTPPGEKIVEDMEDPYLI